MEINDLDKVGDYRQWKNDQVAVLIKDSSGHLSASIEQAHQSFLQIYGNAYALALEICRLCANLERTYRYSLGEQLRTNAVKLVLDIDHASKSKGNIECIASARERLCEIQICLRLLSDLGSIPKKRHVSFVEMTDNISRQLAAWESSRQKRTSVGVPLQ